MKWFRRHRGNGNGVNGKELSEMTGTQERQLEEWEKVKQEAPLTANDRAVLAEYERAEKRRLKGS